VNKLFSVAILIILLSSCGSPDVQLSRDDLRLADSLFLVSRNEWSEKLSDSCEEVKNRMFETWVDSIKKERLEEIEIMLDRHEKIQ
jgi:hypothetical protein